MTFKDVKLVAMLRQGGREGGREIENGREGKGGREIAKERE